MEDYVNLEQQNTLEEINLVPKPSKTRMTLPNAQAATMIEDPFEHGAAESKSGTASF